MKKTNPKMILNLQFENEEFENKLKIAIDEYMQNIIDKYLDDMICKAVDNRINDLLTASYYSGKGKIHGMGLYEYVKHLTSDKIDNYIAQNIHDILKKKLSSLL